MRFLRDPAAVAAIPDPEQRGLLAEHFQDLAQDRPYDPDLGGYFLAVEPGDTVEVLERETGCPILRDLVGEARFGDADFSPAFERLAEHRGFYEIAYILNDDGFGIGIVVPSQGGSDPEPLALCAAYASPVPDRDPS